MDGGADRDLVFLDRTLMMTSDHQNSVGFFFQAKLKEKIQYEDLAGEEDTVSTGGLALRLTKMDRYLHGPTPVSAIQYKTSDDVLQAHQRVMHDMLAWKPDLSQVRSRISVSKVLH